MQHYAHICLRWIARQHNAEAPLRIPVAPHRPEPATWLDSETTLAWLGHATVLANLRGLRLLVDPVLRDRVGIHVGPFVIGPKRLVQPALQPDQLPPVDLLLLTHAHMDHLDVGTLRHLPRRTPVIVQPGMRDLVRRFTDVTELAWEREWTRDGVTVTSLPARHWGRRMLWDNHRGYGGYLVQRTLDGDSSTLLFTGDTADTHLYDPWADAEVDAVVMPIGAYDPWIDNHCTPEQAWGMFERLGAPWLVPVHHRTFKLSEEPLHEPMERLLRVAGGEAHRVALQQVGETFVLPGKKAPPPPVPTSTRVPRAAATAEAGDGVRRYQFADYSTVTDLAKFRG